MSFFKEGRGVDQIQQLSDYIERSSNIVAITGAGISVAGVGMTNWQRALSNRRAGASPRAGDSYSSFLPTYLDNMFSYKPSFAHYALADMEKEGKLLGIITTNVDCMHTIAGSKNVAEIQGSLQVNCCNECGRHYDSYEIWNQDGLTKSEACGGDIHPWTLYSHHGLREEDDRKARGLMAKADLLLVIGTQGNYGGAYWDYRKRDAVIVQINPGHTGFDRAAVLNIREGSDEVFQKLKERRGKND